MEGKAIMSRYYTSWKDKLWVIVTDPLGNFGVMEIQELPKRPINFFEIGSGEAGPSFEEEFIKRATKVLNGQIDMEEIQIIINDDGGFNINGSMHLD